MNVTEICEAWVKDGRGDECFWEGWPGQPECDGLTPSMVLEALRAAREKALREVAALAANGQLSLLAREAELQILALIPKDGEKP